MNQHFSLLKRITQLKQHRNCLVSSGADLTVLNRKRLAPPLSECLSGLFVSESESSPTPNILNAIDFLIERKRDLRSSGIAALLEVQRRLCDVRGEPALRWSPAPAVCPYQQPHDAASIPGALDRFFEWIRSEGFREMHPVEQLTVSHIRLCEVHPFDKCAFLTAWIYPMGFLLEAEYLLPSYPGLDFSKLVAALSEGFRLATLPLLELHLDACLRAYGDFIPSPAD